MHDSQQVGKDGIIYVTRNITSSIELLNKRRSKHQSVVIDQQQQEEVITTHSKYWPLDHHQQPMRDAYDITMDYILGWHSGLVSKERNATVPECWDGWLDVVMNRCRPDSEKPKKAI